MSEDRKRLFIGRDPRIDPEPDCQEAGAHDTGPIEWVTEEAAINTDRKEADDEQ
jgi:hypothetical protein